MFISAYRCKVCNAFKLINCCDILNCFIPHTKYYKEKSREVKSLFITCKHI